MLLQIPSEIQRLVIRHCEPADLLNVRLVCSQLNTHATELLFSTFTLRRREDRDAKRLRSILESDKLRGVVKYFRFEEDGDEIFGCRAGDVFLRELPSLPSISEFSLRFGTRENAVFKTRHVRPFYREVISSLFSLTRTHSLRSISLENFFPDGIVTPEIATTLSKLQSLKIETMTEYNPPDIIWDTGRDVPGEFQSLRWFIANALPTWLEPATSLTSLTLQGYNGTSHIIALDLEGILFPHLKNLRLEAIAILDDSLIDWIHTHYSTLTTLLLWNCPIISRTIITTPAARQNYSIVLGELPSGPNDMVMGKWERTWAEYFEEMQAGLPRLQELIFGGGDAGWEVKRERRVKIWRGMYAALENLKVRELPETERKIHREDEDQLNYLAAVVWNRCREAR
ncbi:hypothetical protein BZA77DRAFT_67642 [Pyronema omphalodes]|nr:hypothetical protein BZA77DRAFT_67642 [Pyronema omphalodes]